MNCPQQEPQEKEIFFKQLFDNMSSGVAVYQPVDHGKDFIFKDMNDAGLSHCKVNKKDIVGERIKDVFPGVEEMGLLEVFRTVLQTNTPQHFRVSKYQDCRLQLWIKNFIFKLPSGEIVAIFDDITIGKKNREALTESEQRLRSLLETTATVPWELDLASGRFTYMGHQIEKILGYPAASWKDIQTWKERLHSEDRDAATEFCEMETISGSDHDFIYRAVHEDGSYRWIRDVVSVVMGKTGPERLVGFMQDITEQKEIEQEKNRLAANVHQNQKLQAIGTLAGGIAHDFNNILGVIIGFTEMVHEEIAADSTMSRDLERVLRAGHRAKDLVKQILTFSRQSQIERAPLELHPIVQEALKMLRASIPATIEIKTSIAEDCGIINADPTQIHQVLMNLCNNAFQAMEKTGGTLWVRLNTAETVPPELTNPETDFATTYIELTIQDTGLGIPQDILPKIFDPFFTTKEKDMGTGMGLSITYGIIQEYGGAITVDSKPGQGTAFHVFIPKSPLENLPPKPAQHPSPKGSEHILLVDDEDLLAEMTRHRLEKLGYTVTVKLTGCEALTAFESDPKKFDLVITDHTMPGMTGLEMSQKLLTIRPDLPIILCTGYSHQVDQEIAKAHGIMEFALKPVEKSVLAQLIRQVLDTP